MNQTEYLTTSEVAGLLRTSSETVRYWRHINKGPRSFKVGRRVLYSRAEVEAFLATAEASAGYPAAATPAGPAPTAPDATPGATTSGSIVCPHCGHGIEIVAQEV